MAEPTISDEAVQAFAAKFIHITYPDPDEESAWRARVRAGLVAAYPHLLAAEVWILGTDYADDEIFGVARSKEEAGRIRGRVGDGTDLSLHAVCYSLPYPADIEEAAGGR